MIESTIALTEFFCKFWNQRLEISSKFVLKLNVSDFHMYFYVVSLKYKKLFMVFFKDFYINYLLKFFS